VVIKAGGIIPAGLQSIRLDTFDSLKNRLYGMKLELGQDVPGTGILITHFEIPFPVYSGQKKAYSEVVSHA
jgi:hypothetical protein